MLQLLVERIRAEAYFLFRKGQITYRGKGRLGRFFSAICTDGASITIGQRFLCNNSVVLRAVKGGKLTMGDSCFFNQNCSVTALEQITIGDRCTFGNNVVIVDHDHDFRQGKGYRCTPIVIGNDVWVGANVTILRGSSIGDHCVIAAGTVVKGKIGAGKLVRQERTMTISDIQFSHEDKEEVK